MHVAREYTEKWLHQQQIRDAVNKQGIMTKELFYPFIDTFMFALPHAYRNAEAENGTIIQLNVSSAIGGSWFLLRENEKWILKKENNLKSSSIITIDPDTAWKLFSKSLRPADVFSKIELAGDKDLGAVALETISVMA